MYESLAEALTSFATLGSMGEQFRAELADGARNLTSLAGQVRPESVGSSEELLQRLLGIISNPSFADAGKIAFNLINLVEEL